MEDHRLPWVWFSNVLMNSGVQGRSNGYDIWMSEQSSL